MSLYAPITYQTAEVFRSIEQAYPNTSFSMERLADRVQYNIFIKFKVGPKYRYILNSFDNIDFIRYNSHEFLIKEISKLLDAKETVRICTKFWTGVEIV